MKSLNCLIVFTLLAFSGFSLCGQNLSPNSDSLRWTVSGFHNTSNGEDVTLSCEFNSRHDAIEWVQQGGDYINLFDVVSSEGSWPDVSQNGSILFNVDLNSLSGTIVFRKENGQTKIIMSLLKDGVNVTPFEFTVTGIAKTPNP